MPRVDEANQGPNRGQSGARRRKFEREVGRGGMGGNMRPIATPHSQNGVTF